MLNKAGEDPLEGLYMIDAIQRLGIDYHFQEEIQTILQRQNMISSACGYNDINNQPYETALRFRLLRQNGYYVSSGCHFLFYNSYIKPMALLMAIKSSSRVREGFGI